MGRLAANIPPYVFSLDQAGNDLRFPYCLMLHGFMGCCGDWENLTADLRSCRMCIAPDIPGHGGTKVMRGPKDLYGMTSVALGVSRLMQSRTSDEFDVIGYSMGGRLALYFAVYYPQMVSRLILESASPGLESEKEREQRRQHDEKLATRLEREPYDKLIREWYDQPLFESLKRDVRRFQRLIGRRKESATARELVKSLRMMGTGAQPSLWDELPNVSLPVLLIVGEKDAKFRNIAERMAERLPDARIEVVPDTGHNVHFEQPEAYAEIVRTFLME